MYVKTNYYRALQVISQVLTPTLKIMAVVTTLILALEPYQNSKTNIKQTSLLLLLEDNYIPIAKPRNKSKFYTSTSLLYTFGSPNKIFRKNNHRIYPDTTILHDKKFNLQLKKEEKKFFFLIYKQIITTFYFLLQNSFIKYFIYINIVYSLIYKYFNIY